MVKNFPWNLLPTWPANPFQTWIWKYTGHPTCLIGPSNIRRELNRYSDCQSCVWDRWIDKNWSEFEGQIWSCKHTLHDEWKSDYYYGNTFTSD